jgi:hypothetical protein
MISESEVLSLNPARYDLLKKCNILISPVYA